MPQAAKYRYRNASTQRRYIRRLGIVVESGDVFESPFEINDANFEPVEPARPNTGKKENDS